MTSGAFKEIFENKFVLGTKKYEKIKQLNVNRKQKPSAFKLFDTNSDGKNNENIRTRNTQNQRRFQ